MTEDDYGKRVRETHKLQTDMLWDLLLMAQKICPGTWVLQILVDLDEHQQHIFRAVVTNGDDNITTQGKTPGSAIAKLIHHLLDGAVFPLTGNMGYYTVEDFDDTPAGKMYNKFWEMAKDETFPKKFRDNIRSILNNE
jgi:hypothetical protein